MANKSKEEFESLVKDALVRRGHGGVKSVSIRMASPQIEASVEHDAKSSFPAPPKEHVDEVLREMETLYGRPEEGAPLTFRTGDK